MNRIQRIMSSSSLALDEALVIFSEVNVTYLSGFTGHAATLLITHEKTVLITDYRYVEQAESEVEGIEVICRNRQINTLGELIESLLREFNISTLLFEADHLSVHQWEEMRAELSIPMVKPTFRLTEELRYIKSNDEINNIRQAANIADNALAETLNLVKEGVTERELTTELEYQMARRGSKEIAFQTILLFAERAALPHGVPGDNKLKHGDFILIDFGATVNGYRSDMTRTYVYGKADAKQRDVYNTVLSAQLAAIDAIEVGVTGEYVHQQSDAILKASPYAEYKPNGLGHGVGLDVHEYPFMANGCYQTLENGCVITVEPGIYIPGWGGVRIEDDVALVDNRLQILNKTPKDQFEL